MGETAYGVYAAMNSGTETAYVYYAVRASTVGKGTRNGYSPAAIVANRPGPCYIRYSDNTTVVTENANEVK